MKTIFLMGQKKFKNYGFAVKYEAENGGFKVLTVSKGKEASKKGLQPGSIIQKVNNVSVNNSSSKEFKKMFETMMDVIVLSIFSDEFSSVESQDLPNKKPSSRNNSPSINSLSKSSDEVSTEEKVKIETVTQIKIYDAEEPQISENLKNQEKKNVVEDVEKNQVKIKLAKGKNKSSKELKTAKVVKDETTNLKHVSIGDENLKRKLKSDKSTKYKNSKKSTNDDFIHDDILRGEIKNSISINKKVYRKQFRKSVKLAKSINSEILKRKMSAVNSNNEKPSKNASFKRSLTIKKLFQKNNSIKKSKACEDLTNNLPCMNAFSEKSDFFSIMCKKYNVIKLKIEVSNKPLGYTLSYHCTEYFHFVSFVSKNSSAHQNGLRIGDIVLKINNKNAELMTHAEAVKEIHKCLNELVLVIARKKGAQTNETIKNRNSSDINNQIQVNNSSDSMDEIQKKSSDSMRQIQANNSSDSIYEIEVNKFLHSMDQIQINKSSHSLDRLNKSDSMSKIQVNDSKILDNDKPWRRNNDFEFDPLPKDIMVVKDNVDRQAMSRKIRYHNLMVVKNLDKI